MIINRPTAGQLGIGLLLAAVLLVAEKLFTGGHHEGGHAEGLHAVPFLGAILGIVGSVILVIVAKVAGRLFLQKKDDFYD
jgi:hypothetical protein